MTIEKERIEAIKENTDLVALIESKGIMLKKNGKDYKGLCPFHEDTNPSLSVNPTTNLWNCFGCDKGGDAIRFVELFDKVDFPQAVSQLSVDSRQLAVKKEKTPEPGTLNPEPGNPEPLTPKKQKLLSRAIDFYHTAFCEDLRGKEYLINRGITDNALFSSFKIGFANGALSNVLPADEKDDMIKHLQEIGILNGKGKELFYGCVTIPLYDLSGNPCGLYGRRIDGMTQKDSPNHLYLPGPRHGLFNRQAAKSNKEIILCESIIDALTLVNAGIRNTIPCYGVHGMGPEHITLFKQYAVETVHVCFDADEMGRQATEKVSVKLEAEGIRTHAVVLPEGYDINSFFSLVADPRKRFMDLFHKTCPEAVREAPEASADPEKTELLNQADPTPAIKEGTITRKDFGFVMTVSGRTYEVMGIVKREGKLKATVKGIKQERSKKRMHIDTVDL